MTAQIPLSQHVLVPPGHEGEDVRCAALSKLLTAGCCARATSSVSVLAGDRGEGSLPVAEPTPCR